MKLLDYFEEAISIRRPHGSMETAKYQATLAHRWKATAIDGAGNIHIDRRARYSRSLFVAHTDTVHRQGGANTWTKSEGFYKADRAALGADDGAGLAVLQNMLARKIPGYYIFTTGEEVGGIGSKFLVEEMGSLLLEFDRAVAFDRANTYEVISHQGGSRCCSDDFAEALSGAFNDCGLLYAPSNGGVYTDTAEYVDLIPECTNIGVGYERQHSAEEKQCIEHLEAIADAALVVDWEQLPTKRNPDEFEGEEGEDPFHYGGILLYEKRGVEGFDSVWPPSTPTSSGPDRPTLRGNRRKASKRR